MGGRAGRRGAAVCGGGGVVAVGGSSGRRSSRRSSSSSSSNGSVGGGGGGGQLLVGRGVLGLLVDAEEGIVVVVVVVVVLVLVLRRWAQIVSARVASRRWLVRVGVGRTCGRRAHWRQLSLVVAGVWSGHACLSGIFAPRLVAVGAHVAAAPVAVDAVAVGSARLWAGRIGRMAMAAPSVVSDGGGGRRRCRLFARHRAGAGLGVAFDLAAGGGGQRRGRRVSSGKSRS
ncbi:hypothetical protein VTK73DRAFT_786 [Phialemonium thermophilum]|uniref:Uncharacterized protein n=1 Tax=Phialemonium thermophilum TaxID=223376 RepID=A0ABR3VU97_9PEZI